VELRYSIAVESIAQRTFSLGLSYLVEDISATEIRFVWKLLANDRANHFPIHSSIVMISLFDLQ
jgi:hypothetical protein